VRKRGTLADVGKKLLDIDKQRSLILEFQKPITCNISFGRYPVIWKIDI
jgi:hypothetical protein